MMKNKNCALLLIDLQNDFCLGGQLAVHDGDKVIPIANQVMSSFETIIASQDWHPANHASFASQHAGKKPGDTILLQDQQQILWPDHCVQNTSGAEFHPALDQTKLTHIVKKGTDRWIDSYSAFYDNHHAKSTGLTEWLRKKNITTVYVMGLATDYCVKYSCLDAIEEGFTVYLIEAGCKGVGLQKHDIENALNDMQDKGVQFIHSQQL